MVTALANKLSVRGFKVTILIMHSSRKLFFPLNNGVEVRNQTANFGIGKASGYFQRKLNFFRDNKNLKREIRNINPEFIISTNYFFTASLVLSKLHCYYKVINWEHTTFKVKRSCVWKIVSTYAYSRIHAIVALNDDEQSYYTKYNKQVYVIPNFIDLVNKRTTFQKKEILTIARFEEDKGIDLLLLTAKYLFSSFPDWRWRIIANGVHSDEFRKTLEAFQLTPFIVPQQPTSAMIPEFQHASMIVMTSRRESFGLVLVEAMSYGIPCIAFDCDTGPKHIISNNIDGLLIERENPEKLAEAISNLIKDKEKRSLMGEAAYKNVMRFSSDVILKKWEDLFNFLLHSSSFRTARNAS